MPKLFYDDEFDALAQTIANSERSFKECAAFLFPHLKPESQYARLKNCLNPTKEDERLSFSQIITLCKFCDSYDALHFMCRRTPARAAHQARTRRREGRIAAGLYRERPAATTHH